MKTIRQLSEELCISKEAIYKKLKYQLKEQLEGHVSKIDNVTHIDDDGERAIRQSLNRERHETIQVIMENTSPNESSNQTHVTEYVNLLEEQIKTKDEQIETQNSHIGILIRQMGNSQLLYQAERTKELLSSPAATSTKISHNHGHRPLWRRLFGRQENYRKN